MAAGSNDAKRQKLAKAALAKSNTITLNIEGVYEEDRQKFQAMAQDLGITFDANNNVLDNAIKEDVIDHENRITVLESSSTTNVVVSSADYLVTSLDKAVLASNNITITLPTPPTAGHEVKIKKTDTAGTINIVTAGPETIDGADEMSISSRYEAYALLSDGTNWYIV